MFQSSYESDYICWCHYPFTGMVTPLPGSLDHKYHGYLYFPVFPVDGLYPTSKMAGISPILILKGIGIDYNKWVTINLSGVGNNVPTRSEKRRPTLTP